MRTRRGVLGDVACRPVTRRCTPRRGVAAFRHRDGGGRSVITPRREEMVDSTTAGVTPLGVRPIGEIHHACSHGRERRLDRLDPSALDPCTRHHTIAMHIQTSHPVLDRLHRPPSLQGIGAARGKDPEQNGYWGSRAQRYSSIPPGPPRQAQTVLTRSQRRRWPRPRRQPPASISHRWRQATAIPAEIR